MARSPKPPEGCGGCHWFRERDRLGMARPRRQGMPGRPPSDLHHECTWYQSQEGRAAENGLRLSVMTSDVNGGVGCRARRTLSVG